jgi:hypothetical protein
VGLLATECTVCNGKAMQNTRKWFAIKRLKRLVHVGVAIQYVVLQNVLCVTERLCKLHGIFCRGEDKFFKTLAKLASCSEFSHTKSENDWPKL